MTKKYISDHMKPLLAMIQKNDIESIKNTNLTPDEYIVGFRLAITYNRENIMEYLFNFIPRDKHCLIFEDAKFFYRNIHPLRYIVWWAIDHNVIISDDIIHTFIENNDLESIKKIHEKQPINVKLRENNVIKLIENQYYELIQYILNNNLVNIIGMKCDQSETAIIDYLFKDLCAIGIPHLRFHDKHILRNTVMWAIFNGYITIPDIIIRTFIELNCVDTLEKINQYQSCICDFRDMHLLHHDTIVYLFNNDISPKIYMLQYACSLKKNNKTALINKFIQHKMFAARDISYVRSLRKILSKNNKCSRNIADTLENIYKEYIRATLGNSKRRNAIYDNIIILMKYFKENVHIDSNLLRPIVSYISLYRIADKAPFY